MCRWLLLLVIISKAAAIKKCGMKPLEPGGAGSASGATNVTTGNGTNSGGAGGGAQVDQAEACKQWWHCRKNWLAWGKNLRETYPRRADLNVGEYFCVRIFECLKARKRFCVHHADDGHETVCMMCKMWFGSA